VLDDTPSALLTFRFNQAAIRRLVFGAQDDSMVRAA